jgi:putative copper export protein
MESLEALSKIPLYAGALLLIGFWVSLWLARTGPAADAASLYVSPLGRLAAVVLVGGLVLRLFAHSYATFGGDAWTVESLTTIGVRSRWGSPWRLQLLIGAGLLWAAVRARRQARVVTVSGTLFVVALAFSFTMMGHSASEGTHSIVAAFHILAAGAWLGTLGALVAARHRGILWRQFSTVAMAGSILMAVTGLLLTYFYVATPANLVSTPYGRLLAAKLVLVAGIGVCGFINWRRVKAAGMPSTAGLELAVAALVVIVTAFLTETEHP